MDLQTFQNLPTEEIAKLVRETGPKVCVFPINGTRRWFMLEYPELTDDDISTDAFIELGAWRLLEICELFFEHGIDTVLAPILGPDIMERGNSYAPVGIGGLQWFTQNQKALDFYASHDVRVRMYGDARRYFSDTPYACTLPMFDDIAQQTANHQIHRLFLGVCAHDATETVAEIGVRFYQEHGRLPDRRQIIETYYGEFVESVDIFIGSGQPSAFDMPLVATGNEDLYFTVAPSAYLDAEMLRTILYDHLYVRSADEADYNDISPGDWGYMENFYTNNRKAVLGLGYRNNGNHFWYPLSQTEQLHQIKLPLQIITPSVDIASELET